MPKGGDLRQYDHRRDLRSEGDAARVFYDLCRDTGLTPEQSRRYAEKGAQRFCEGEGEDKPRARVADGTTPATPHAAGQRYRTPHFGPHAGQLCRVLPDGTLERVEQPDPARIPDYSDREIRREPLLPASSTEPEEGP